MNASTPHALDRILNPQSIVIVGASRDPAKRGNRAIRSLLADRYTGRILPINPRESEILGLPCYPSIQEAPGEIDLAVICTAASTVKSVIEECGRRKVKGAILLAAGFSEAGEQGRVLEDEVVALARAHGVRLIGPNTNGMFSARLGCNAWGMKNVPRGPLGLLSNSANCVTYIVMQAKTHGHMGINTMLSVGNQADIQFHEYLDCLGADPDVSAVMLYLEGFKDARAFREVARRTTRTKPVVMYVAGRTGEGKRAAKSHSGSLAGVYAINRGALRQAGVTLVERIDHLYPVAEALSLLPPMRGRRVAVLSEGGGPLTVAADALVEQGFELAQLTPETQARIHAVVPNATAISNPIDAGGGTDPRAEYYGPICRAILEDPNIDALLIVGLLGGYADRFGDQAAPAENAICAEIGQMMKEYGKPVVVQSHYAEVKTPALDILRGGGVPYQRHIEIAVQCLTSAAEYGAARRRIADDSAVPGTAVVRAGAEIAAAVAAGRDLLETEARDLLRACGVAVPAHVLARSPAEAAAAARTFGDAPLAMKIVSPDILHKSEAGGVRLHLVGVAALEAAYTGILASALAYMPDARIEGVLVTPMIAAGGTEVIVGVTRDPQHGPVVVFGLGGIFVELIGDVAFRTVPLARADALEMIGSLRYAAALDGVRGAKPVNREALADLLVALSAIVEGQPEIQEIDLNPVIAGPDGYAIADARIVLRDRTQGG